MSKTTIVEYSKRDIARGQIFRITRIVKDYEMSEMASMLEISKSYLSLLENAKRSVSDKILNKYLECFGIERQVFNKLEEEVIKILSNDKVEIIEVAFLVVKMLKMASKGAL